MASHGGVDSAPNQLGEQAAIRSPWHAMLPAAMALSRLMEGEMDRGLAKLPLRAREFALLREVQEPLFPELTPPPARTQRELAARLGLSHGATNELLSRLERRRLLERTPAGRGARGRPELTVTLTAGGEAALAAAATIARQVEDDWARRLNRGEQTPVPGMRAHGLRRWLLESLAALSATTRGGG